MTDLVLAIRFPVVGGAHGQDDDHDEQSPAGGQDGYQGFIVRGLLWKQETGRLVLLWRGGGLTVGVLCHLPWSVLHNTPPPVGF